MNKFVLELYKRSFVEKEDDIGYDAHVVHGQFDPMVFLKLIKEDMKRFLTDEKVDDSSEYFRGYNDGITDALGVIASYGEEDE